MRRFFHRIKVSFFLQTLKIILSLIGVSGVANVMILQQKQNAIAIGAINVTTGTLKPVRSFSLPNGSTCEWVRMVGNPGQGTATFRRNRTFFFLAQQVCGEAKSINQTALISTFISDNGVAFDRMAHENIPEDHARKIGGTMDQAAFFGKVFPGGAYNAPLKNWNVIWDHVCNVIVVAPRTQGENIVDYETWMISEYDWEARKQHSLQPPTSWTKSIGFGALDDFGVSTGGPYQLNCGDNCSLYTLQDKAGADPRIVGRNFHTGEETSSIANSLSVKTLTGPSGYPIGWSSRDYLMIGLGFDRNHQLILVGYGGSGAGRSPLVALESVGDRFSSQQDVENALRVGVLVDTWEYERLGEVGYSAYVFWGNTIKIYDVRRKHHSADWSSSLVANYSGLDVSSPLVDAWVLGQVLYSSPSIQEDRQ